MVDLILGALLVLLGIKGWMRGLVKEVISLAVLVTGTILSFRLSTPLGRVFAAMSGASPDATRIVAGFFIFFGVAIAAAIVSKVMHLGMRFLPGVSTLNRAAGAALSLVALALLVTVLASLAAVVPLPEAMATEIGESAVAAAMTEPEGIPQRVLGFLSGDRVVEITLRIQEMTGGSTAVAVPGVAIAVPVTPASDLKRLPDSEDALLDLLNRERVSAGVDPVLRSSGLDQVAFDLGTEGYGRGEGLLLDDDSLRRRLNGAGLPSTSRTELVVLAASPETGHAALADTRIDAMSARGYTKVGIAVLRGPAGLLIVEVLSG